MKVTKFLSILAIGAVLPLTANAFGPLDKLKGAKDKAKDSVSCDDDHGVEKAGKEMDEKAYSALIATETSLADVADAAGNKDVAANARKNLETWKNKEKAPSGLDRIKQISKAADLIQKGADEVGKAKLDDKAKKSVADARNELRRAVVYVAWSAKIAVPIPGNAKDAIAAKEACTKTVKGPVDAAAGVTALTTNIKTTYTKVSDAAKKAGAPDMSDADKKKQDSELGAPGDLGV